MTPDERAKLQALRDHLRTKAESVRNIDAATDSGESHQNGVSCGLEYSADELDELMEEFDDE